MRTVVINGTTYKIPESVVAHNESLDPGDFYNVLYLKKTFTGYMEFERLEEKGFDYLNEENCECWQLYADLHGIEDLNDDRLLISDVGNAMYAIFADYKNEDYEMHILEKA